MKLLKKLHLNQLFLLLDTCEKKFFFSTMGSVSNIAPKIARTPLELKLRKCPKTAEIIQGLILPNLRQFLNVISDQEDWIYDKSFALCQAS